MMMDRSPTSTWQHSLSAQRRSNFRGWGCLDVRERADADSSDHRRVRVREPLLVVVRESGDERELRALIRGEAPRVRVPDLVRGYVMPRAFPMLFRYSVEKDLDNEVVTNGESRTRAEPRTLRCPAHSIGLGGGLPGGFQLSEKCIDNRLTTQSEIVGRTRLGYRRGRNRNSRSGKGYWTRTICNTRGASNYPYDETQHNAFHILKNIGR